jgi:hypothetical protein
MFSLLAASDAKFAAMFAIWFDPIMLALSDPAVLNLALSANGEEDMS